MKKVIGTPYMGRLIEPEYDEDDKEVKNLYDKIEELERKKKPLISKIEGKIKKEIKKFPVLFSNFRWVNKYSSFVLCGKYVIIGFDEEYNRYAYLISNISRDEYIESLSYNSYDYNKSIYKFNTLRFDEFFTHFFDNLENNIPDAYKQYMRMKKLERIIGQNDEE